MKTPVKDIMTTRVVSVREDTPFKELAAALRTHRVSAFPVLDSGGKVIGVVSEADLLTKEAWDSAAGVLSTILHRKDQQKALGITAGDLMSRPAVIVAPEDTAEHAATVMYTRRVKRLPVVDENGHLVGIISRADVLAVFDRSDEEICNEIINDVMPSDFLFGPEAFTVTVREGVVTLSGMPKTRRLGHQLVQRTRHVQGVVAVRDRLSYPSRPASPADERFDALASFPID